MPGKHSTMKMSPKKMKTPMDMKSPMKGNAFSGARAKAQASGADSFSVGGESFPLQMKEPMKMKSPAKMGTAYKLDKSAFKMKNGPMKMYGDKAGSMAKMAGVMKMKTPMNMSPMKETDVTEEYKTKGNEATRKHIADGGRVIKKKDGSLIKTGQVSTSETVAKMSSPAKSTTKMPTLPPKKLKVREPYYGQIGPSKPDKKMNRRYS